MEEVFNFPYAPRLARLLWASVAEPLQKTLTDLLTSPAEFSLRDGFSVLMVDMQSWFLDDFDEVTRNRIIRSQCDVLNFCIRYGIPIAVLEYAHRGHTIARLNDLIEQAPRHSYFTKSADDGFSHSELLPQLNNWGNNNLLMMGVKGSGCLLRTAESAFHNEFLVHAAETLTGDPFWEIKDPAHPFYRQWFTENGVYRPDHHSFLGK